MPAAAVNLRRRKVCKYAGQLHVHVTLQGKISPKENPTLFFEHSVKRLTDATSAT